MKSMALFMAPFIGGAIIGRCCEGTVAILAVCFVASVVFHGMLKIWFTEDK